MKHLILKVQDKTKVPKLKEYCHIVYVSNFLNTIGIEIAESNIEKLDSDSNVISYTESREGTFQLVNC